MEINSIQDWAAGIYILSIALNLCFWVSQRFKRGKKKYPRLSEYFFNNQDSTEQSRENQPWIKEIRNAIEELRVKARPQ